jgi:hypothetical protein
VSYQEEQYLLPNRPAFKKLKSIPADVVLNGINNIIKYHNFKHIALDNGVPNQIHPKTIPKKGQTFSIG